MNHGFFLAISPMFYLSSVAVVTLVIALVVVQHRTAKLALNRYTIVKRHRQSSSATC